MSSGYLDILNCGAGHLSFKFDKNDREQVDKARKVLTDMLKRGYMLFIERDGKQQRIRSFDAEHDEYILEEPDVIPESSPIVEPQELLPTKRRRGRPRKYPAGDFGGTSGGGGERVPLKHGRVTAVGPVAGG